MKKIVLLALLARGLPLDTDKKGGFECNED